MPVLRLALEIDGDVYPELYAKLVGLERPEACAERLRVLAATGLAWEAARIHGAAVAPGAAVAAVGPGAGSPAAASGVSSAVAGATGAAAAGAAGAATSRTAPSPRERAPRAAPRAPAPARAPTRGAGAEPAARAEPDFIDLAISVDRPQPAPAPPRAARAKAADRAPPPDHVPLLLDVVNEPARAAPAAQGEGWPVTDDGLDSEPAGVEAEEVVHPSRPRSRLLRMKERGLFKNG